MYPNHQPVLKTYHVLIETPETRAPEIEPEQSFCRAFLDGVPLWDPTASTYGEPNHGGGKTLWLCQNSH